MSIRAVIFDIGGVLLRTEDRKHHQKWEARLGLPERGLVKAVLMNEISERASLGQASLAEVWQHIGARFQLNEEQLRELERDFAAAHVLNQELLAFIRTLRPCYRTGLLSNAWPDTRELYNQKYRFCDEFDELIFSAEEGMGKPDPRIYTLTIQRLDVQPQEAIFVDDWGPNVEGARIFGMQGVLFKQTTQAIAEIQTYLKEA